MAHRGVLQTRLTGPGWLVVHLLVGRPEGSVGWHIKVFCRLEYNHAACEKNDVNLFYHMLSKRMLKYYLSINLPGCHVLKDLNIFHL